MKIIRMIVLLFCGIVIAGCGSTPATETKEPPRMTTPQPTRPEINRTEPAATPTSLATATEAIITYNELQPMVVSTAIDLAASPSHPDAYLPGRMVQANQKLYLVGRDQNSAWLLVIDQGRLGWIPSVYSSIGVGTLNLTTISKARLEACTGYLGSILRLHDVWESNLTGMTIVQGLLYRSPAQASSGEMDLSLQIEETGQEHLLSIDSTYMETGGQIVSFTAILEGMEQGYHVKFRSNDVSAGSIPFAASFFNGDCSQAIAGIQPNQTGGSPSTPLPPVATRFVHITTYAEPHLIPTIDWNVCRSSYSSQLNIGMSAIANLDPALAPDILEEPYKDSSFVGDLEPGEEVSIVEGPSCSRGWIWWKVVSKQSGATGWTSEGDGKDYWLIPVAGSADHPSVTTEQYNACRADYLSRLNVGDAAYISYDPPLANNVREKPDKR
jgi:hypothetical protein